MENPSQIDAMAGGREHSQLFFVDLVGNCATSKVILIVLVLYFLVPPMGVNIDVSTHVNPRKNQCKPWGKNKEKNKNKFIFVFSQRQVGPSIFCTWKFNINRRHPSSLLHTFTTTHSDRKGALHQSRRVIFWGYILERHFISLFFSLFSRVFISIRRFAGFFLIGFPSINSCVLCLCALSFFQ